MRLSLNTILIALVSSSVIMTDVFAVPLTKISHSAKQSKKLVKRQDASSPNSTVLLDELEIMLSSVQGLALLAESAAMAIVELAADLSLDNGDSDSGNDGQDGGDPSGSDGSGSTDGSGSGDTGDAGESDGSDSTPGSTANQRRNLDSYLWCRLQGMTAKECNHEILHG